MTNSILDSVDSLEGDVKALIETLPQIIWISKTDGSFDYFNEKWYEYSGLTKVESVGSGWKSIIYPEDLESTLYKWNHSIESGAIFEIEYRLKRAMDDEYRWHLGRAHPAINKNGDIIRWIGTSTDIHEQKLIQDKLHEERANRTATENEIHLKIKQHKTIAEFGLFAIKSPLDLILKEACDITAHILELEYCKILKYLPENNSLLLLAGTGWKKGLVGNLVLSAGKESHGGYTLLQHEPVVVVDLNKETRFISAPLLFDHGVTSGVSVIIEGKEAPYGVLSVHTTKHRIFSEDDTLFLQAIANVIAEAVQRRNYEEKIESSLKEKEVLLKEIHHRVKNNLQIVSSLMRLQASYSSPEFDKIFQDSQSRVRSMALIHEKLYQSENFFSIDLGQYINELTNEIKKTYQSNINVHLHFYLEKVSVHLDKIISIGLIINEIVSNSFKYAFAGRKSGNITIKIKQETENLILIISDDGIGFTKKVSISEPSSLGLSLIGTLTEQLGGNLKVNAESGVEYQFIIPN